MALLVVVNFAIAVSAPNIAHPAEARTAAHPLDGTWTPDLAASAKFFKLPEGLKNDLAGLRLTLLAKNGTMALSWDDGARDSKTFRIVSFSGKLYNVVVGKRKFSINAAQKDLLVFTEQDAYGNNNSIVFKRLK
jgi:hypothetical protein